MPLEIRELVVRATVHNGNGSTTPGGNCGRRRRDSDHQINGSSDTADPIGQGGGGDSSLVQQCVEQVLAILERQKDR